MSWLQGVLDRKDVPPILIKWAEGRFLRSFGREAKLQYITWFEDQDTVIWDFGQPEFLETEMSIDQVFDKFK